MELGLAQRSRSGKLIDTNRGRLIVPVLAGGGRIDGFIGRDTTGDPRAPKYRNPTKTPTFDKSAALFRPTQHRLDRDANVVVVEGVLDALAIAIAAAAARGGEPGMFAPATTSGVTVSEVQARAVLALHLKPAIIALDCDAAGRAGTDRWLAALCVERGRTALVTRLPDGADSAEWLQHQGVGGLRAFGPARLRRPRHRIPQRAAPGRDLARICFEQPGQPVGHLQDVLSALALQMSQRAADELIDQAELEMPAGGRNPRGHFGQSARAAIAQARSQAVLLQNHQVITATGGLSRLSTETPRVAAHQGA